MITVLSHSRNPGTKEWWKHMITRRLLGLRRGPDAVRESLLRGLDEIGIQYRYNKKPLSETVLVLSGVEALKEAIEAKKGGLVKKIVAGPNVAIHPHDHNKLMCDSNIDLVLVPSNWTRDYWINEAPEISWKIKVWAAGVASCQASSHTGQPIVYDKIGDPNLLERVKENLDQEAKIFSYGSFSQTAYLKALKDAPFLIYLAKSESQGLALQEAWARNVPTIVNYSTRWELGDFSWEANQINAPYLTKELGAVFKDSEEIPDLIRQVASLNPKIYCDNNLSDKISTQKLLEII